VKNLSKPMRNDVFEAVEAAGLNPREFDWDVSADDICLRHVPSDASFVFGGNYGAFVARYAVGDGPPWETESYSWRSQMEKVKRWLSDVKRDVETPDLWAELLEQTKLLGAASDAALENTPFTSDERNEIARQLDQLKEYAAHTASVSSQQLAELDTKLDYLREAGDRLGRKDWLNIAVGTMLGWYVAVPAPPEVGRHMFQMLLSGAAHFFGHHFPGLGSG
jgi:hypothetical protein